MAATTAKRFRVTNLAITRRLLRSKIAKSYARQET
jgi:hypothetical protein